MKRTGLALSAIFLGPAAGLHAEPAVCDAAKSIHMPATVEDVIKNKAKPGLAIRVMVELEAGGAIAREIQNADKRDIASILDQNMGRYQIRFDTSHFEYLPSIRTIIGFACAAEEITPLDLSQRIAAVEGVRNAAPDILLKPLPPIMD